MRAGWIAALAVCSLAAAPAVAETWRPVGDKDGPAIDVDSLKSTGPGQIAVVVRQPLSASEQGLNFAVAPVDGAVQRETVAIDCRDGARVQWSRRELLAPGGRAIASRTPSDADVQAMKAANDAMSGQYGEGPYGFACAYMTAKCARSRFRWPVDAGNTDYESDLQGHRAYEAAAAAYQAKFVPKCEK